MSARPRIHRIASHGAAIMISLGVFQSAEANESSRVSSMSIEDLKGIYLGCEQAATTRKLNGGDVIYCSLVYEELKEKAFEGDFRRIKSWLDSHTIPLG
jgi:hypothetical protein